MTTLLLVRGWADVRLATKQVNEFLALRRSRNGGRGDGKVIAVWVRSQLDVGLPTIAGFWIRESLSLGGIWTLCWLDGPLLASAQSSGARRDAILQVLVDASASIDTRGLFFPVFDRDESTESVWAEVLGLKARYPGVIGSVSFRHDESRGVYCSELESQ